MKTISSVLRLLFFTITSDVAVAASDGFTCERIKEKAVREACVKDRATKESAENAEKARIAAEKAQVAAARENEAQA